MTSREKVLNVSCRYCGAKVGKLCKETNGRGERCEIMAEYSHKERFNDAE